MAQASDERPARVWHLLNGATEVARLVVTESDFPWLIARLEADEGFLAFRPLFDDEARLALAVFEDRADDAEWEAAYYRIRERLQLVDPDGISVPEFLLSIDGDRATWRWSDEPFEVEPAINEPTPSD